MQEITVEAAPLAALEDLLTEQRRDQFIAAALRGRELLAGRMVWNVNATAHGGGVAEMLAGLLAFGRGAGVDTRWLVLDGDRRVLRDHQAHPQRAARHAGRRSANSAAEQSTRTTTRCCRTTLRHDDARWFGPATS